MLTEINSLLEDWKNKKVSAMESIGMFKRADLAEMINMVAPPVPVQLVFEMIMILRTETVQNYEKYSKIDEKGHQLEGHVTWKVIQIEMKKIGPMFIRELQNFSSDNANQEMVAKVNEILAKYSDLWLKLKHLHIGAYNLFNWLTGTVKSIEAQPKLESLISYSAKFKNGGKEHKILVYTLLQQILGKQEPTQGDLDNYDYQSSSLELLHKIETEIDFMRSTQHVEPPKKHFLLDWLFDWVDKTRGKFEKELQGIKDRIKGLDTKGWTRERSYELQKMIKNVESFEKEQVQLLQKQRDIKLHDLGIIQDKQIDQIRELGDIRSNIFKHYMSVLEFYDKYSKKKHSIKDFEMGRLLKDLEAKQLDQITAKIYLDQNVFGMLEEALNHLLETIESNGEFEKYVEMLANRQEREQKELRRRAREMKRLELGDDYISSGTEEEEASEEEDEDSYGDESGGEEVQSVTMPERLDTEPAKMQASAAKSREEPLSAAKISTNGGEIFNPLRFMALHLKELNEVKRQKMQKKK